MDIASLEKKSRRKVKEIAGILFPENFSDEIICSALNHDCNFVNYRAYPLVCGLILRLKAGFLRVYRRSECKFPRDLENQPRQFFELVSSFTKDHEKLECEWNAELLWNAAKDLSVKSIMISVTLQKEISGEPFVLDKSTGYLAFRESFIAKVHAYHDTVRRPEGTFDIKDIETCKALSEMPRIKCPNCNHLRQIYCGPCGGIRIPNTETVLPPRIELPFDVVLFLHYQESLVKCTGIHTGALCTEGSVSCKHWNKSPEEWQKLVEEMDAEQDVILFPYADSINAEEFDWQRKHNDDNDEMIVKKPKKKWRLVVLEASWQYGKAMAPLIMEHRKAKNLPPIKSVILTNITGQYWRFQSEGHSAVSTIEAIAYCARAAGISEKAMEDLLVLFRLQKYRVLHKPEGKIPRAVEVEGDGKGSWKEVSSYPDHVVA